MHFFGFEDVWHFYIPVNDVLSLQIKKSLVDVVDQGLDVWWGTIGLFGLFGCLMLIEMLFELSVIAKFGYDVAIIVSDEDVVTTQYVGVFEWFKYLHFCL